MAITRYRHNIDMICWFYINNLVLRIILVCLTSTLKKLCFSLIICYQHTKFPMMVAKH